MRVKLFILFMIFILPVISEARRIQIIHTNDLHSYFSGYHNGVGGYAKLLTKIKEIKAEARAKGLEVLQLDAGDWGDGTSFYLSDQGADSIRALELLGVEVAAIGNHDHMIGGKVLGEQIRRANVETKFVAANIVPTPDMALDEVVLPYVDVNKAGIKIRVIGLTTSSNFYKYSMRPGTIKSPRVIGEKQAKKAKRDKRELVIALTHLGLSEDKKLVQNSSEIDVVIGGHSHSRLNKEVWVSNKEGKGVPIVQAWAHGLGVGVLTLDVSKRGKLKVISYKLHQVPNSTLDDSLMKTFVEESSLRRSDEVTQDWDEVLGESKVPFYGNENGHQNWKGTCWGKHIARATREAVGAEVGLNVPGFAGAHRPAGPVTFGDIVDHFPHIRNFGDQGWEIATVSMPGWKLRPLMYFFSRIGYGLDFSGLGYKSIDSFEDKALYTVAFPSEIAVAINGSLPIFKGILRDLEYNKVYLWEVLSKYVKENSPIQC